MYLLAICLSIKSALQMLSQIDALLCHISVAQSNGMLPPSTDIMCLYLWMLRQSAVSCLSQRSSGKAQKHLWRLRQVTCVSSLVACVLSICLICPAVSWMFLATQRSDYIAVMNHLKPIQDLIVSEHFKTPGKCAPLTNTACCCTLHAAPHLRLPHAHAYTPGSCGCQLDTTVTL